MKKQRQGKFNKLRAKRGRPKEGYIAKDGCRYWLTPPDLMDRLQKEFHFDFDACPNPRPKGFNSLKMEWGKSTYVNPPFFGPTKWVRKAIEEANKGKTVVFVFPTDKWIHYLIKAGAELRSLGDVKWCDTKTKKPGKGSGRFTMAFILRGKIGQMERQIRKEEETGTKSDADSFSSLFRRERIKKRTKKRY